MVRERYVGLATNVKSNKVSGIVDSVDNVIGCDQATQASTRSCRKIRMETTLPPMS